MYNDNTGPDLVPRPHLDRPITIINSRLLLSCLWPGLHWTATFVALIHTLTLKVRKGRALSIIRNRVFTFTLGLKELSRRYAASVRLKQKGKTRRFPSNTYTLPFESHSLSTTSPESPYTPILSSSLLQRLVTLVTPRI